MFKNYLTYQFALSFDRACRHAELSPTLKQSLLDSGEKMLGHFKLALETEDMHAEAQHLYVSLLCLRDCRDLLDRAGIRAREIEVPYAVLVSRLEQLCLSASPARRRYKTL